MASGAGDRVSSSWSKFESLAVFGVATVDFGLGFTPYLNGIVVVSGSNIG